MRGSAAAQPQSLDWAPSSSISLNERTQQFRLPRVSHNRHPTVRSTPRLVSTSNPNIVSLVSKMGGAGRPNFGALALQPQ